MEFAPDWCMHPGELLADVLDERGLRQSELAERTGLSAKHINQIIKKSIGISPDVAILLERALSTPADFWIRAEAEYQEYESRQKAAAALDSYRDWAAKFDRPALERHGILKPADSDTTMVDKLLKFFQVATPAAFERTWVRPSVSFRRSQAFTIDEPNTAVWLRLVELSADAVPVAPFNPRLLRKAARALPKLTTMTVPNGFIAARAALAEAGVALTFVREIRGTRVCAATWWITGDRPAIGITVRHKRPDNFWFSLLHEVGHVVLHPRRESYLDLETTDPDDPAESEANEFASGLLFPGDASERIARARSQQDLILIAAELGVGVPSVAGRYGKLTQDWKTFGRLRATISEDDIRALEAAAAQVVHSLPVTPGMS
ncbi:HigA family addiction module antitoxin [Micromonospora sp. NPDC005324]|uniref:HigA family addiction module antitoxin n=1 Tax=Micromonospora sp. NPDC005324 TaxID=3157033 RepID=UPI0033AB6561